MVYGQETRISWRRIEKKYIVTAAQAAELSRFCRRFLEPDHFAARSTNAVYPILSIYFDSPKRDLLRHALEKRIHRFKLRIRSYGAPAGGTCAERPSYLEIKRKDEGVSQKFRACVPAPASLDVVRELAEGADWLDLLDAEQQRYAREFCVLARALRAEPAVAVYYHREAYETQWGGRVRITLDRDLQAGAIGPDGSMAECWWPILSEPRVIVEIKYDNACPFWLADLFRRNQLNVRSHSKYVRCIQFADRLCGAGRMRRVVG